jgi:eukaryotic-like serine/threonine-protein kinase
LVARCGALSVADACEIARQAARGLAYIHQHGMVHRDVKPSNLMLAMARANELSIDSIEKAAGAELAIVKILDLGLALLVGDDQQRLTVFDARAMGTAMYMSPEQWKTTSVDIRADIYSLGCTLYHLLAGKPPFWHSDLKPEKAHEREKLPPIDIEPRIPRGLWDILQRMTAKNPNDRYADPAEVAAALAPFAEGNALSALVRNMLDETSGSTRGASRSETMVAKSADSDTLARSSASRSRQSTMSARTRHKVRRVIIGAFTLAAVAAIGWLAILATGQRESAHEATEARQRALKVAAQFASSEILKEINRRFDILNQLASEAELRQQMVRIKEKPTDETLWKRLEDWLGARKADHAKDATSDSWFINDAQGVQVARSPRSEATRGENFAHRDYFSGQGTNLPADTKDIKPIKAPHLSAVYRSTSTGHLKVAFSVPIENGKKGKEREVVGVLAMTVDCGEFNVLEKKLPKGLEVVLIDMRESTIDGPARRGLILHNQHEDVFGKGAPPPCIGPELLVRIEELLKKIAGEKSESNAMLVDYRDDALTGKKLYSGALEPLVENRDEVMRDSNWVVLVQEPTPH